MAGTGAQSGTDAGGGGAQGGSSGAGGGGDLGGTGPVEGGAGGAAPEPEQPQLILLYADHSFADPEAVTESKNVRPIFAIRNQGDEPVDVSELSIRYYFTLEAPTALVFECDFVNPNLVVNDCDGVLGTFVTLPDGEEAKDYLELTFEPPDSATWTIPEIGGESGPIQVRFYKVNFGPQNQENDYSFVVQTEVDMPPVPWDKVTLYRGGSLVYGIEPN